MNKSTQLCQCIVINDLVLRTRLAMKQTESSSTLIIALVSLQKMQIFLNKSFEDDNLNEQMKSNKHNIPCKN